MDWKRAGPTADRWVCLMADCSVLSTVGRRDAQSAVWTAETSVTATAEQMGKNWAGRWAGHGVENWAKQTADTMADRKDVSTAAPRVVEMAVWWGRSTAA